MADRTKRARFTVTFDVDFRPDTQGGFDSLRGFGRHVFRDVLDLDGIEVVDEAGGDDFYVTLVDVEQDQ